MSAAARAIFTRCDVFRRGIQTVDRAGLVPRAADLPRYTRLTKATPDVTAKADKPAWVVEFVGEFPETMLREYLDRRDLRGDRGHARLLRDGTRPRRLARREPTRLHAAVAGAHLLPADPRPVTHGVGRERRPGAARGRDGAGRPAETCAGGAEPRATEPGRLSRRPGRLGRGRACYTPPPVERMRGRSSTPHHADRGFPAGRPREQSRGTR